MTTRYLLDSDHLSILERARADGYDRLFRRIEAVGMEGVAASIVSFQEQCSGWMNYIKRAQSSRTVIFGYEMLQSLIGSYGSMTVLPFDNSAADTFARLKQAKVRVGTLDLRIASIALSRQMTVITRNMIHFQQVPGLRCEDWTQP